MKKLFGTDGIRGQANVGSMKVETVLEIGRAVAFACRETDPGRRHRILIGKDTRVSGYMLENALTAGICSLGVDVLLVGPLPTPGIAFATHSMRCDAGVVISASHNAFHDNGIKLFSRDGTKFPDEMEAKFEALVGSEELAAARATGNEIGRAKRIDDAAGRYIVFCKNTFPDELSLEGLRIAVDTGHGATYKVAPIILGELGAEVVCINNRPDGTNINDNCGSQHTSQLREKVRETRADLGLAFDGDGDRLIAVDELGEELSGDHIIAILAKHLKDSGALRDNQVVTTVMSNFGFKLAMESLGITHHAAKVGDRHVLEMMKAKGACLGGEQSGHIIFSDHHTTGDGIIAALQLLAVIQKSGKPLSKLAKVMTHAPQLLINVPVASKPPIEELEELTKAIADAETTLDGSGRVLIRYSGTEPKCRVMVEAQDAELTERLCNELADTVKRCIG